MVIEHAHLSSWGADHACPEVPSRFDPPAYRLLGRGVF